MATEREIARAKARGRQLILFGLIAGAALFALSGRAPEGSLLFLCVLLLGLGALHLVAPGSALVQRIVAYDTRFVDAPGEAKYTWTVPRSLVPRDARQQRRRYRVVAAIGLGLALLLVALRLTDPSPPQLSWGQFLLIPLGVVLLALFFAWVSSGRLVTVTLRDDEAVVRSYALGVGHLTTHVLSIRYDQLAGVELEAIPAERERWRLHLVSPGGARLELGLSGASRYGEVVAFLAERGLTAVAVAPRAVPSDPSSAPSLEERVATAGRTPRKRGLHAAVSILPPRPRAPAPDRSPRARGRDGGDRGPAEGGRPLGRRVLDRGAPPSAARAAPLPPPPRPRPPRPLGRLAAHRVRPPPRRLHAPRRAARPMMCHPSRELHVQRISARKSVNLLSGDRVRKESRRETRVAVSSVGGHRL